MSNNSKFLASEWNCRFLGKDGTGSSCAREWLLFLESAPGIAQYIGDRWLWCGFPWEYFMFELFCCNPFFTKKKKRGGSYAFIWLLHIVPRVPLRARSSMTSVHRACSPHKFNEEAHTTTTTKLAPFAEWKSSRRSRRSFLPTLHHYSSPISHSARHASSWRIKQSVTSGNGGGIAACLLRSRAPPPQCSGCSLTDAGSVPSPKKSETDSRCCYRSQTAL